MPSRFKYINKYVYLFIFYHPFYTNFIVKQEVFPEENRPATAGIISCCKISNHNFVIRSTTVNVMKTTICVITKSDHNFCYRGDHTTVSGIVLNKQNSRFRDGFTVLCGTKKS